MEKCTIFLNPVTLDNYLGVDTVHGILDHLCRAVSVDKRTTKVIKRQENTGVLFQIFLLFASTSTLKNRVLTVERAYFPFPPSALLIHSGRGEQILVLTRNKCQGQVFTV